MQPFIAATDLHGIEQDRTAVKVFKGFVEGFDKKAIKIFTGDLWNFAALRRQAAEHEKSIRLKEDFEAGLEFLEWYRPSLFIRGNHDERLWDAVSIDRIKHSGWKAELAQTYITKFEAFAKDMKIKVLPYNKASVFRIDGMAFAHGFGSGESLTENMAKTYGNVIFGHGHRIERTPVMQSGRAVTGYQIGCLCRDDMDFVRSDLGALKQEQGWAYGFLAPHAEVFQARVANGKALVAENFKVISGAEKRKLD